MSKKGYFKVIEAMIAVFIIFFVITFIISRAPKASGTLNLLPTQVDNKFRQAIIEHDESYIIRVINETNPGFTSTNNYFITFDRLSASDIKSMAGNNDVYVYTLFVAGNYTNYNFTVLRVYYWKKT